MRKMRMILILAVLLLANTKAFGSLPIEPEDYRLCAENNFICVEISVEDGTTAFSANGERLWHIDGWFQMGYLSDDGVYFVAGEPGRIPCRESLNKPALVVWKNGEKRFEVLFNDFISEGSEFRMTQASYCWGNYIGIVERHYFYLTTVSGKAIYVNLRDGSVHERNYLVGSMEEAAIQYAEGSFVNAANIWKYQSRLGNCEATIKLAYAYVWGEGVPHSFDHAIKLLKDAIASGCAQAGIEMEKTLVVREHMEWRNGRLRPKYQSSVR